MKICNEIIVNVPNNTIVKCACRATGLCRCLLKYLFYYTRIKVYDPGPVDVLKLRLLMYPIMPGFFVLLIAIEALIQVIRNNVITVTSHGCHSVSDHGKFNLLNSFSRLTTKTSQIVGVALCERNSLLLRGLPTGLMIRSAFLCHDVCGMS